MIIQTNPEPICPKCGRRMVLWHIQGMYDCDTEWSCILDNTLDNYICVGRRGLEPDGTPQIFDDKFEWIMQEPEQWR